MSKLTVARALTARIGRRAVIFFSWTVSIVLIVLLVMTIALVYFFSAWWWLLLIPALILLGIFLLVRLIVSFILRRIHGGHLNKRQREALDEFIDKIQQLLEARATPPWIFVFITIKDIVLHRDITTIKKLIHDTSSLQSEYKNLERYFN